MTPSRKLFVLALALASFLSLSACADSSAFTTISRAMLDISAANLAIQNTVMTAVQSGGMTVDEARPIIQLNLEVAQAGKQVDAALAGINALSPADKTKILSILQPVIAAATNEANTITIANPDVKNAILASLATIQSALATARVALAG